MDKIGIFYGSTDGNTENVVEKVQAALGKDLVELHNVDASTAEDVQNYSNIIFACPTWEIGELQEDWESFIDILDDIDFSGKKISYIGLGDADGYPDTFLDALGIIHDRIKDKGATFVGKWSTDDYTFDESRAVVNGKFLGLAIDEDSEPEKTDGRIKKWVEQIKTEF